MNRDPENRQTLRKSLAQLRGEISRLEFRDGASRQKLEQLMARVELHLDDSKDRAQLDDLLLNVSKTMSQFEVEHPNLTASLRQIIATLSTMGI